MRPLRHDRSRTLRTYVLDCETTGLGEAVSRQAPRGRPPAQLVCCVYDGETYRRFWGPRSVEAALEWVISQDEDAEVFAHFGGSFDFRLAHRWLFDRVRTSGSGWRVVCSGSFVIVCAGRVDGIELRLVDSIRLLPGSLREIGEAVGTPKWEWDHRWHHDPAWEGGKKRFRIVAPVCMDALARYCERDCLVLWKGLEQMRAFARSQGVELRATIASTASASIRLKLDLDTIAWAPRHVAEAAARACSGGRVADPIVPRCGPAMVFDIQSSYPAAMLRSLPWRYLDSSSRYRKGQNAIVDAAVEVPADCKLPPLPYRVPEGKDKGRVFYPTGAWRAWFVGAELDRAVRAGAKVLEVFQSHRFEGSRVMARFARRIWKARRGATGFLRYALKIWLNSVYGKLAESEEHEEVLVHPPASSVICARHRERERRPGEGPCGCRVPVVPSAGLYAFEASHEPAFRAPWAAAAILAIARVRLYDFMSDAYELGGQVYYDDTDSITTDVELPTGTELGNLSLERRVSEGRFIGPKMYAYRCEWCAKKRPEEHPHDVVKAKGFSRLTREEFDRIDSCPCGGGYRSGTAFGCPLCGGRSLQEPGTGRAVYRGERSEGFKEALARGRVEYRRIEIVRQLRETRPKRAAGGRPWSVGELALPYSYQPGVEA